MKSILATISTLLILLAFTPATATELPQGVIRVAAKPAPPLQLDNLDGEAYDLENARGRWRFVHFWASWYRVRAG
jgi:hypothetical protein